MCSITGCCNFNISMPKRRCYCCDPQKLVSVIPRGKHKRVGLRCFLPSTPSCCARCASVCAQPFLSTHRAQSCSVEMKQKSFGSRGTLAFRVNLQEGFIEQWARDIDAKTGNPHVTCFPSGNFFDKQSILSRTRTNTANPTTFLFSAHVICVSAAKIVSVAENGAEHKNRFSLT